MPTSLPPHESCKICGSRRIRLYCTKDNFTIYQCQDCRCGSLLRDQHVPDLHKYYQSYYNLDISVEERHGYDDYFSLQKSINLTSQKRVDEIIKYLKPAQKPSLLDIGCGPGFFLKEASNQFNVYGTDISHPAVQHAQEKLNLNVLQTEFQEGLFGQQKFDVITLWDVIEHLPDPNSQIQAIARTLKPGGLLALTTGDIESFASRICGSKWHLITLPDHLFFFSKKGMRLILERNGLEIVKLSYPFDYYTVDYLLERATKSLRIGLNYRKHEKLKNFLSRFIVPFSLIDIMFVVARKKND